MDKKFIFSLTFFLFISNFIFSQSQKDLYDLIGLDINSNELKKHVNDLGKCKVVKFAKNLNDYDYENSGIKFRADSLGTIKAIICGFCKNCKNSKYTGKLPFDLTFTDNMTEIEGKIGRGAVVMEYGFYGRTLQWKVQDLYRISMEVKLPKDDTENLYIEYMIFSKINKE